MKKIGRMVIDKDRKEEERRLEMASEVEYLKTQLALSRGRLNDTLTYGFKQNQENAKLHRYIGELEREIAEGVEDEKNRLHDNT